MPPRTVLFAVADAFGPQDRLFGPIGLAVIKRSTALDAPLSVEGIDASQEPVVAVL